MHSDRPADELTLANLSIATGIPGRTIRFYIAQGLLDGPNTAGRTARYATRHLERLQAIQAAKQQGLTLGEIRRRLAGPAVESNVPSPAPVEVFTLSPEVTVLLRTDGSTRRLQRVREALAVFAEAVGANGREEILPTRSATPASEVTAPKEDS